MSTAPATRGRALSTDALLSLAEDAVRRARAAGAEHAEACLESARAFTVRVNGGAIESLKQSGTNGLGVRVIVGGAIGFASATDLRPEAMDDLARRAIALAKFSTPDPANAMPTPEEAEGSPPGDLALWDPETLELTPERKIEMALELERVALGLDPRIARCDGVAVSSHEGAFAIANSNGVAHAWAGTSASAWAVALANDRDGRQQTGAYGLSKRHLAELPSMESIAREAARRAVSRVGARTVPAARVPVVMHPDIAAAWIAEMADAFTGESVIKKSSWLTDKLGASIAAPGFTLIDDGRMRAGLGTSPYDGEGIATRRTTLVDRGVCAAFLYDLYHARRAGAVSTGNAARGYSSQPGIGTNNLFVEPGTESPEAILRRVDRGFYYDDQGSFGFNPVTGDYSFQAQGFWIENGEKAYPVEGVTVAGNSLDMLRNVAAIGNDLEFHSSIACPTLLISELTVSGSG